MVRKLFLLSLFSAAVSGFQSANAQTSNLLANPGFEDTDFETFGYESVVNCPNRVAGWNLAREKDDPEFKANDFNNSGLSKYMVRGEMGYYSADSDTAKNGNKQFIRVARYEWTKPDEWSGDAGMQQTIDVLPSHTYSMSFLYRLSAHANNNTLVPAWVAFQEGDKALTKKKLYNNLKENWMEKSYTFTTSADATKATIHLGVTGGSIYSWGGNMQMWADYDEVLVADEGPATSIDALLNAGGAQIDASVNGSEVRLSGLEAGGLVNIYSVVGNRVTSFRASGEDETVFLPAKGIYIIKNGDHKKALKVVIK